MRHFLQLGKVLQYIDAQLALDLANTAPSSAQQQGDLSIDRLSAVACWSKFHFQRQFQQHCGLTVQSYIRLRRLLRASSQLVFREMKLNDISALSGYQNSESFSRAFAALMAQSPAEFRQNPDWQQWQVQQQKLATFNHISRNSTMPAKPDIVEFTSTPVIELKHKGSPSLLGQSIRRFIAFRKDNQLPPARFATFNFLYTDPANTADEDFCFGLAVAVPDTVAASLELPDGFNRRQVPTLRCARLSFVGDDHQLEALVSYLYRDWLPESGEQLADFPIFVERKTFFPEVAAHLAENDIYLPLQ
ncbi:GyrI-like domain-containing protein [Rheinheimera sp. 4Y26]|uniref:AraC family transcriptional regulator n=1 Tax=Rheinheimera sp. 4Y26 TaxID=2977811 RepID=UPI0021B0F8DC|nr:GyrI-like domain-containing protein [Rheinheimera sp. 4Y26]MCT6699792.1 GyrI-like domain-containing protein [Rheinheimera sp. 4Y26]